MPEVVAAQSGPQGRAHFSWNILDNPVEQEPSSPEEALGEHPARESLPKEEPEPEEQPSAKPEGEKVGREPALEADKQQSQPREEGRNGQKLSRYERTKRQRKALEEREIALAQREAALAREKQEQAERERKANEPPYTLAELRKYRSAWDRAGNYDLVEQADAEIQRLEALEAESKQVIELPRAGTAQFRESWQAAEKELYQYDPEFQREGTRLDKVLREMMSSPEGDIYRQHPRGIIAAYHKARLDIAQADLESARSEIQKLKTEVSRLNGLTSVGGKGTAARGLSDLSGKDFASMSTAEMREHLKRNAQRNVVW
jgi:hypothetical protein